MQSIRNKAFFLLSKRDYFSKELERKLKEKGYPQEEIAELLADLTKRGWLKDEELALRFCKRQKEKGYGPRVIAMKLREKSGLSMEPQEESLEIVENLIQRKYRNKPRDKIYAALLRRGFSCDLINKALENIS